MAIWTAFTLSLLGSLHCVGMCGPICLALNSKDSKTHIFFSALIYHLGRMLTYILLGSLLFSIGQQLFLIDLQRYVSIFSGVLLIIYVFFPKIWNKFESFLFALKFFSIIKKGLSFFVKKEGYANRFFLGIINGFLPCGLVYIALLLSISQVSLSENILYMFFFGLGTLPAMLSFSIFSKKISTFKFFQMKNLKNAFISVLAVLFILRGMSLGIPYLSPEIILKSNAEKTEVNCCK